MNLGQADHLRPEDYHAIFKKAKPGLVCSSWAVFTIRDRKTGIVNVVLMFFDEETRGDKFTYAFSVGPGRETALLCERLMGASEKARKMING